MENDRYKKMKESKRIKSELNFIEFLKSINDGNEFKLISKLNKTSENVKILHTMENGESHEFIVTPNNFKKRLRCTHCNPANKPYTTKEFKEEFYKLYGENEFEIIGEYINNKTPISVKCKSCNKIRDSRPVDLLHGNTKGSKVVHKCPYCNLTSMSKDELELKSFIESNYKGTIIYNDRKVLNGKELDIYLPDIKIAIEFNGLYWHCDEKKDKKYHLNKTLQCEKYGIKLIHLFEDEWIDKKEIVKNKLLYILKSKTNKKIYARKCYIEEISANDKKLFLNENHIQGNDSSCINLGLWYKEDEYEILMAVMTFCKPRISLGQKKDSKYDFELSRFATEKDFNVIGAFGKLFSYFKENYEWSSILTYADRRWSSGGLYFNNNFSHIRNSEPNYFYYDKNKRSKRLHRYSFRKSELKNKFPDIYDDNKSESIIMKEAGYSKVYDCGNMVFEYNR